jgi:polar amino acid transport system substrate-binding protein
MQCQLQGKIMLLHQDLYHQSSSRVGKLETPKTFFAASTCIANREYDWLADGVTVTPERAEIVDFSIPYVIVRQVLLVRENETASLDEIKADSSRTVGTQIGTTNEIVALQHFPAERVSSFEDFGAAVLATLSGDIDGVVIDNVSADGYMEANPGQLKIQGELASDEELAFAFPPGSDLLEPVNAALESMRADGKLEEINLQWGLSFEQ